MNPWQKSEVALSCIFEVFKMDNDVRKVMTLAFVEHMLNYLVYRHQFS
jgi:hypothetical protein